METVGLILLGVALSSTLGVSLDLGGLLGGEGGGGLLGGGIVGTAVEWALGGATLGTGGVALRALSRVRHQEDKPSRAAEDVRELARRLRDEVQQRQRLEREVQAALVLLAELRAESRGLSDQIRLLSQPSAVPRETRPASPLSGARS